MVELNGAKRLKSQKIRPDAGCINAAIVENN
jgi:hypothetical protein